ncbi:MAG: UbiX family flavin prenyltransferase [Candidatus Kariarchaeaceae archaeon]|jgi:4-hydroxy-3-polyprenylbenzoate decarboxylase
MNLIVAMSGGSGAQYGLRLIEVLTSLGHEVELVVSDGARKVLDLEVGGDYQSILDKATNIHDVRNIGASIASGTHKNSGMIIVPCSMKTLAAVANGFSQNLIHRAADCMMKEGRKLVLVNRETPLNRIHLKNMLQAQEAGATILPASPGFYYHPKSVDDVINFVVGKVLNVFGIDHNLFKPWDPETAKSRL